MSNYKKEGIKKLAKEILKSGFRVFIAESGEYGFYTDKEGTRLVSFHYDLCNLEFSGNYRSTKNGSGWRIDTDNGYNFNDLFKTPAPNWAIGGDPKWHYTTLKEHQEQYQKSSRYVEITE